MIKVEGEKVTEINRRAQNVEIPSEIRFIGQFACINGFLLSLNIKHSHIINIGRYAFSFCYDLAEITFPPSLEEICEGAFKNCVNLQHIHFGSDSQLKIIGPYAFNDCNNLETLEFPPLLEIIGDFAFKKCNKLKTYDFRNTRVRLIGKKAIKIYKESFVSFPATVTPRSISYYCSNQLDISKRHRFVQQDENGTSFMQGIIFRGNKKAMHMVIRRGVEKIALECFYKAALVSVVIPASVTEIGERSFFSCKSLKRVRFAPNSQLREIKKHAFFLTAIKEFRAPSSLKVIRQNAFDYCKLLENIIFPHDSQLERIEITFFNTKIKNLSLPRLVKEIEFQHDYFEYDFLDTIFIDGEYYKSNEERNAVFSKDGSELVCLIKYIDIPECVRVIKRRAFSIVSTDGYLQIPSSVEIIEEKAFLDCKCLKVLVFQSNSRLRSLGFNSLPDLDNLVINNEHFITCENGVVMSVNPRGIVFVPRKLKRLRIEPGVEVIYSYAFSYSNITKLVFPNSLKKISSDALYRFPIRSVSFEEGTELDSMDANSFIYTHFRYLKLPLIKETLGYQFLHVVETIEFPPNFNPKHVSSIYATSLMRVICPKSSLETLVRIHFKRKSPSIRIPDNEDENGFLCKMLKCVKFW